MRVVIDSDVITYRIAWSCEDRKTGELSPLFVLKSRIDTQIEEILEVVGSLDYQLYLTGGRNYRLDIYPEYKSSRSEKPQYYQAARDHMVARWGAIVTDGIEADDAMAIEGSTDYDNVCIASIDKDMLQVPCWHYNFVKGNKFKQDEFGAIYSFYAQLLTGDSTDDIPGLKGIGPKKAEKLLAECSTEEELRAAVVSAYEAAEESNENLIRNGKLLYLLRHIDDEYTGGLIGSNNS